MKITTQLECARALVELGGACRIIGNSHQKTAFMLSRTKAMREVTRPRQGDVLNARGWRGGGGEEERWGLRRGVVLDGFGLN